MKFNIGDEVVLSTDKYDRMVGTKLHLSRGRVVGFARAENVVLVKFDDHPKFGSIYYHPEDLEILGGPW